MAVPLHASSLQGFSEWCGCLWAGFAGAAERVPRRATAGAVRGGGLGVHCGAADWVAGRLRRLLVTRCGATSGQAAILALCSEVVSDVALVKSV